MEPTLSHPVTVADEYLAAILEELQALRATLETIPIKIGVTDSGRVILLHPGEPSHLVDATPAKRPRRRKAPGG